MSELDGAGSGASAALQRRIGAPRSSAARTALAPGAAESATTAVVRDRPRSRRSRGSEPVLASPVPVEPSPARQSRVRNPEHHAFTGTVAVTAGPFDNLDPIGEFAEAVSSIPGVGSVRIRTFDRSSVVFEVELAEPTELIASLRGRSHRPLRLLYAGERIIRLQLV